MSTDSHSNDQPTFQNPADSSTGTPQGYTNGNTRNFDETNVVAFIGHGVEFKGTIKYQGSVRVDGKLEGEVHADGTLFLGEKAVITAKISAQSVISRGQISGDVVAMDTVQLLAPAVLDGSVKTPSLLMEQGVLFNGTCEMGKSKHAETSYTESLSDIPNGKVLEPV